MHKKIIFKCMLVVKKAAIANLAVRVEGFKKNIEGIPENINLKNYKVSLGETTESCPCPDSCLT